MTLSETEAKLFFKLMLSLQAFANDKLGILPDIKSFDEYQLTPFEEKAKVHDALFENVNLFDQFIDENPFDFPMAELTYVSKWKKFVKGTFYIERYLKNYAIFIAEDNRVYQVSALRDSFEAMIPKFALPQRITTNLLPFQDRIIYDGFIKSYNVFFGSGISNDLKRIYMKAKHNEKIIASFDEAKNLTPKKKKAAKNWKPEIQELLVKAKKMRSDAGQNELLSPSFSLVKASLELAELATSEKPDFHQIYKIFTRIEREFGKAQELLYYLED